MKNIIISILISIFIFSNSIAGPFGLRKGMTIDELKKQGSFTKTSEKYVYKLKSLAKGHPDFEMYTVLLTPNQGLCYVTAIGKDFAVSGDGAEMKRKNEELVHALEGKYGAPYMSDDSLKSGSIWNKPNEWMIGLYRKERNLSTYWISSEVILPDSLKTIILATRASSSGVGFFVIRYDFDNEVDCEEAEKSKRNSNL
jgi:hypothetical protein